MPGEAWHQALAAYTKLLAYLIGGFLAFLQRPSPLYWPFLVSALLIVAAAWAAAGRGGRRRFARRYFGAALWWHPSARADYRYYIVNAVFFPLAVGPALFTGAGLAGALDGLAGLATPPAASGAALRIAYTVLFFVAYDFGRFLGHSALHDVPLLWEFHKVHHSAEVVTPLTAFRAHPLDLAVMAWGSSLATGLATWLFQHAAGVSVGAYTFLGLHVLLWGFSLIGNLKHWLWLPYGRVLDRWLISPAHHLLHHSAEPRHFGKNRGFEIALWDRLYGTLAVPVTGEEFRMGLGDGSDGRWHRVWRLYLWPFGLAAQRLGQHRDSGRAAPARPGR